MSPTQTSPRFGYWVIFFIISVVTLGALIEARAHTERLSPAAQTNQNYAVACCVLLFMLSMMVVFVHTRPLLVSLILGTRIEGGIILIMLTFWSALVAIVGDTRHGLATDASGSISNGNLYYFSWAGLGVGLALMLSFIRSVWGIDVSEELRNRARRLRDWVWLGIFGLIQMDSSARLFDNHCGQSNYGLGEGEMGSIKFCRRCQLGIVLGVFSAVISMAVTGVKLSSGRLPWLFPTEFSLSGIMLASQAVGVSFLTSQQGPGAPLNNLFYSSWASFVLTLVLAASCVEDWSAANRVRKAGANEKENILGTEGELVELRGEGIL